MRRVLTILQAALLISVFTCGTAFADTLSDFRLGHFSLNLGYWAGTTDLSINTTGNQQGYLRSDGGNFDGDISMGLGNGFAVRYGYTGLSNNYSAPGNITVNGDMNTQDVMLMWKTGNGLGNTLLNLYAVCTGQEPHWTADPENGNNYAIFLGYSQFNDKTQYPQGLQRKLDYDRGWEAGVVNAWPINNKLNTFGKGSFFGIVSGPAMFVAEAGFSYSIVDNATINLSYKTATTFDGESVDKTDYLLRTGFRYGICFWY